MRTVTGTRHYRPDWQPTPARLLWLAAALVMVLVPHLPRVPPWVGASFLTFALWRVAVAYALVRAPSRILVFALQLLVVTGIYASYGQIFGRSPGVALLVALAGMKLLETRSLRDAFACVLLGYFLVITQLLYSQTMLTAGFMFLAVVVMTATLNGLNTGAHELGTVQRARLALSMVLLAVPVMLVLFLLFPRLPGPLWGLPKDAANATTGLSDSLTPGSVSRLSQSAAVAFRAHFDGPVPAPPLRYWRGPVMWDTDGRTWRTAEAGGPDAAPVVANRAETAYTVILEPHDQSWLYLLDMPTRLPHGARLSGDYQVLVAKPVKRLLSYEAASTTDYAARFMTPAQRVRGLYLPPGAHPRTRQLAESWLQETGSPEALVRQALTFFNRQPFYYTMNPPLLDGDNIDRFLFESRRGFCEHYATAFTVLARAAGIPARVVTGYQGGEINPIDGTLVVRQQDAHAWSEVWLEAQGWVRVDPTAAVSPTRIEAGLEQALPGEVAGALLNLNIDTNSSLYGFWRRLRNGWDAVDHWWNQWVLGYGQERQRQFLDRLGLDVDDWRQLGGWLLVLLGGTLLAVAFWLTYRGRERLDRPARLYRRFCRKLARRGVPPRAGEGPLDLGQRAALALPGAASRIARVTDLYVRSRYANRTELEPELARAVAEFGR